MRALREADGMADEPSEEEGLAVVGSGHVMDDPEADVSPVLRSSEG